ncbi:MAG: hypothetical protein LBU64_06920 [Planctomycetota bacterium]|jgi:hypothetical protein|nr:hypothetical protein [Planctomycetota bacterium]
MSGYLDQIPKQLAARRKLLAAARTNPALLPGCWTVVKSIANNLYDYMRNIVISGCTFPDRPIYISPDDTAFLNFGASPRLLALDALWREAEAAGGPPPEVEGPLPELPASVRSEVGRRLAQMARARSPDPEASRVYNLEAWLQDMYRDRMDADFAEDLQARIDAIETYMNSVPESLRATGLTGKLLQAVIGSFNLFKTITGSSHQLDREKMSLADRRNYVDTVQKIEAVMSRAEGALGSTRGGRSVVRDLYEIWKNANYEMASLTRELHALWAGTSLDERITELANLLAAIQKTLNRCREGSIPPQPQLPALPADPDLPDLIAGREVEEEFGKILLYEQLGGGGTAVSRELRKFGPLVAVLTPGYGRPRYCSEIRRLESGEDEEKPARIKHEKERDIDVDRRVRYPLNCLVIPVGSKRGTLADDLADAWLEYQQAAFPTTFKEFLEEAKAAAPEAFPPPPGQAAKDPPAAYARERLARLVSSFSRWACSGREPAGEESQAFNAFRGLVLKRLDKSAFFIPPRHRPFLTLFSEAGPARRIGMWKRCLGPRLALDRQLTAINVVRKDWKALRDSLKYLPVALVQGNHNLDNGFAKIKDAGDPFSENKALGFFRRFLEGSPDLKAALGAMESQIAIEVETLRVQSESLGQEFQFDQASDTIMKRQVSQIQEKRNAANAHIDQYLTGLMYALDGNFEAAEGALATCLVHSGKPGADESPPPEIPGEIGEDWFASAFPPREGKFPKRLDAGENGRGTACSSFLYYNLGMVYLRRKRHIEAAMCFRAQMGERRENCFLLRQWAETLLAEAKANITPEQTA